MYPMVFVFLCLSSLNIDLITTRSIGVAAEGIISFVFMNEDSTVLPHLLHPFSADGRLSRFHALLISAVTGTGVHLAF